MPLALDRHWIAGAGQPIVCCIVPAEAGTPLKAIVGWLSMIPPLYRGKRELKNFRYHNRTLVTPSVNPAIIGTGASRVELLGSGRGVTHVWGYNLVPFVMARLAKKAGRPVFTFFTKKMIWSPMVTLNIIIALAYLTNEAFFQCD